MYNMRSKVQLLLLLTVPLLFQNCLWTPASAQKQTASQRSDDPATLSKEPDNSTNITLTAPNDPSSSTFAQTIAPNASSIGSTAQKFEAVRWNATSALPTEETEADSLADHSNLVLCPKGFQLVAGVCADIDECRSIASAAAELEDERRDVCGNYVLSHRPGYRCVNTPGSYRCERIVDCGFGYVLNETVGACIDVDECAILGYEAACGTALPIKVCINLDGTFRCEYRGCPPGKHLDRTTGRCEPCPRGFAKTLRDTCQDVNECERVAMNSCQPHMRCVNFEGGYECKDKIFCTMGRRANYNGTECIDIDECREQPEICGLGHNCINTDGEYRCEPKQCGKQQELSLLTGACKCIDGFRKNATSESCEDINECAEGSHNCEQNDVCRNTRGHFDCLSKDKVCEPGFGLNFDRSVCVDIDECKLGQFKCSQNEYCINTHGSYTCLCRLGFQRTGRSKECIDIDECAARNPARCPAPLLCANTVGSFACRCPAGFRPELTPSVSPSTLLDGDPRTTCRDIDECAESPGICGAAGRCRNTPPGSYTCTCASGYMTSETVGGTCVDIDECKLKACPPTAVCTNSPGRYDCNCGSGFRYAKENNVCEDIDECQLAQNATKVSGSVCPVGLSCFNYRGHFACYNYTCPTGFTTPQAVQKAQDTLSFNCDAKNASCPLVPGIQGNGTLTATPKPKIQICVTRHRVVQKAIEISATAGDLVTIQSEMRYGQRTCHFRAISTLSNNSTVVEVLTSGSWNSTDLRFVQFSQKKLGKFTICSTNLRNAVSGHGLRGSANQVVVKKVDVLMALITRRSAETSEYTIHIVRP